jgi:hypothetical protein
MKENIKREMEEFQPWETVYVILGDGVNWK